MTAPCGLLRALLLALAASAAARPSLFSPFSSGDAEDLLVLAAKGDGFTETVNISLELAEFDYEDQCRALATARWEWLLANRPADGRYEEKLWRQEAELAEKAAFNVDAVEATVRRARADFDPELRLRVEYALQPGDRALPQPLYRQKLNYSQAVQRAWAGLRAPCSADQPTDACSISLPVAERVLALSGDAALLLRTWSAALAAARPLAAGFGAQVALAASAAAQNARFAGLAQSPTAPSSTSTAEGSAQEATDSAEATASSSPAPAKRQPEPAADVEAYWQQLQDAGPHSVPELTFSRAAQLWEELKPLHRRLARFVRARLSAAFGPGAVAAAAPGDADPPLPAHLLGSLTGADWSPLADLVFPGAGLRDLEAAMDKRGLSGRRLYSAAMDTLQSGLGVSGLPRAELLRRVRFDGTCPAQLAPSCSGPAYRVLTCGNGGWQRYAEAHEVAARLAHAQLGAARDERSLLRRNTRYSALHDALPGAVRLLALHPTRLRQLRLLPAEPPAVSGSPDADEEERAAAERAPLLLLAALRSLPRLAHLAAADGLRLRLLRAAGNGSEPAEDPAALWAKLRQEYGLIVAPESGGSDVSFLADADLVSNVPFLGQFAAELLSFQVYESLTEYNPEEPLEAAKDKEILKEIMDIGWSEQWPRVMYDHLDIHEISTEAILHFFEPLESILDELAGPGPASARSPVDLSPPPTPAPPTATAAPTPAAFPSIRRMPPAAPTKEEQEEEEEEQEPQPPPVPADPAILSDQPPTSAGSAPAAPPTNGTSSEGDTALAGAGGSAEAGARSAVLAVSLAAFGAALAAGALVGGRRMLRRRRKYERNRRPKGGDAAADGAATAVAPVADAPAAQEEDS